VFFISCGWRGALSHLATRQSMIRQTNDADSPTCEHTRESAERMKRLTLSKW
jgi:hypothetical protein